MQAAEFQNVGPVAHGGSLARARALFPQVREPWIDLSTGINPHSYPYSSIPDNAFSRLPEPADLDALKAVAAEYHGAPSPDHVAAGPGTQILLPIVASLYGTEGGKAVVLSPTYAEHARACRLAGMEVVETDDVGRLAEGHMAVVVNPNNPTGRIVARADLIGIAGAMREKGGLVVVDEAFIDVSDAESVAGMVAEGGLLVLRSFGKFYGLAGLRLGFAIGHPGDISRIESRLGPWAVSGPALHVARQALADVAWQGDMRRQLADESARLGALLADADLKVFGGSSLFRLVRDARAADLFAHFGRLGIMTRRFDERPDDLRIGLPGPQDWATVEAALKSF